MSMSQEAHGGPPRRSAMRWLALLAVACLFGWLWLLSFCGCVFQIVLEQVKATALPLPTEILVWGSLAFREYGRAWTAAFMVAASLIAVGKLDRWAAPMALAALLLMAASAMFACMSLILPYFEVVACSGLRCERTVHIRPLR